MDLMYALSTCSPRCGDLHIRDTLSEYAPGRLAVGIIVVLMAGYAMWSASVPHLQLITILRRPLVSWTPQASNFTFALLKLMLGILLKLYARTGHLP